MENEKINAKSWREDTIVFEVGGVIEYTFKDTRPNNFIITSFFNQKPLRISFDRNPNSVDYDYYFSGKNQYTISRPHGVSVIRINCAQYGQKLRLCSYEGEYTPCFNMNTNEDIAVDIANTLIYTTRVSKYTSDISSFVTVVPDIKDIVNEINLKENLIRTGVIEIFNVLNRKYGHFTNSNIKTINLLSEETFDSKTWQNQIPVGVDRDIAVNIVYGKFGVNSTINVGINDSDTDVLTFTNEETYTNFDTYSERLRIQGPFHGILRLNYN